MKGTKVVLRSNGRIVGEKVISHWEFNDCEITNEYDEVFDLLPGIKEEEVVVDEVCLVDQKTGRLYCLPVTAQIPITDEVHSVSVIQHGISLTMAMMALKETMMETATNWYKREGVE